MGSSAAPRAGRWVGVRGSLWGWRAESWAGRWGAKDETWVASTAGQRAGLLVVYWAWKRAEPWVDGWAAQLVFCWDCDSAWLQVASWAGHSGESSARGLVCC